MTPEEKQNLNALRERIATRLHPSMTLEKTKEAGIQPGMYPNLTTTLAAATARTADALARELLKLE